MTDTPAGWWTTVRDAAQQIGMHHNAIFHLIRCGFIPDEDVAPVSSRYPMRLSPKAIKILRKEWEAATTPIPNILDAPLMNIDQAAAFIGVSDCTIEMWIKKGVVRSNSVVRVRKETGRGRKRKHITEEEVKRIKALHLAMLEREGPAPIDPTDPTDPTAPVDSDHIDIEKVAREHGDPATDDEYHRWNRDRWRAKPGVVRRYGTIQVRGGMVTLSINRIGYDANLI